MGGRRGRSAPSPSPSGHRCSRGGYEPPPFSPPRRTRRRLEYRFHGKG
jgi:hypothetical protein